MTIRRPSPILAGRDDELADLTALFERARDGLPAVVLISGEPGIGKSRLVQEFISTAATDARILTGSCVAAVPLAPFTAMLRGLNLAELGRLLPENQPNELTRLIPALGLVPTVTDPLLARARLFEQFLCVLRGLSDETPVVVVVEDLQLADRSTRMLIDYLIRNAASLRHVLVLATFRSVPSLRTFLADLGSVTWVEWIELGRLTRTAVALQLEGILAERPDAALLDRVFRRSAGVPLLVESLVLIDGQPAARLPARTRDVLLAPLEQLPPQSSKVVHAAAVIDATVNESVLSDVTGFDESELPAVIEPAIALDLLVVNGDGYTFRHALIRELVYEGLAPNVRTDLHARYAEVLSRSPGRRNLGGAELEISRHLMAVRQQFPDRALAAAWRAAAAAAGSLAYTERLLLLEQVLDLWGEVEDAATLLGIDHRSVVQQTIEAALSAGAGDQAKSLIDQALSEVDPESAWAGQLMRYRGELLQALGLPGDIEDGHEAARLVPAGHPDRPTILNVLAARLLNVPRDAEGRAIAEEALGAAELAGDGRAATVARINLAYLLGRSDDLDTGLAALAACRTTAERMGDDGAVLHALRCESDLLQGVGRHRQARDAARRGLARATGAGLARTAGPTHAGNLAEALFSLGQWDEAVELIEHALDLDPAPSLRGYLQVLHGTISLSRGDLAAAERATKAADRVLTGGTGYAQDLLMLVQLQIALLLAKGQIGEAAQLVHETMTMQSGMSPRYLWPIVADGAVALNADARLSEFVQHLTAFGPVEQAYRLVFEAEFSSSRKREHSWRTVASAWKDLEQPYQEAKALVKAVEAAAEDGRRMDTTNLLLRASSISNRLNAQPLQNRISRLQGQPSAPQPIQHGLTAREVEVL